MNIAEIFKAYTGSGLPIAYRLIRRAGAEPVLQGRYVFSDTSGDNTYQEWRDIPTIDETAEEQAADLFFNVNDYAYVRLTPIGRAILTEQAISFAEDGEGWSRWPLWELMSAFGDRLCNGCDVPFETTIRLVSD
jgi:hypothetical protein